MSHANEWSDGGGPSVVMLSVVDGPPGPSVAAVHGPGDPAFSGCRTWSGGTIGSVTDHNHKSFNNQTWLLKDL